MVRREGRGQEFAEHSVAATEPGVEEPVDRVVAVGGLFQQSFHKPAHLPFCGTVVNVAELCEFLKVNRSNENDAYWFYWRS